jgi:hypothetical protein
MDLLAINYVSCYMIDKLNCLKNWKLTTIDYKALRDSNINNYSLELC